MNGDSTIKVIIKGGDQNETESYCYYLDSKEEEDVQYFKQDVIKLTQIEDMDTRAFKLKETEIKKKIAQGESILNKIANICSDGSKDTEEILCDIDNMLKDYEP